MAGFPIRYVARAVKDNGKVVAYFPSKVYVFEEIKKYKSDGSVEEKCEIDFVTQIYDEKFEVENSPALKRYYKDRVFINFVECSAYVNIQNYQLWQKLIKGLSDIEIKQKQKEHKKYFKFAIEMRDKYKAKDFNI